MDNTALFFAIYNLSQKSQVLDSMMVFITNYVLYLTMLFTLILAIKGKVAERKAFLLIILGIPISILFILGIHLFIHEPRPFVAFNFIPLADNKPGLSFPSRHTTLMAVMAFSYIYFKSKWSFLFLILAALVGISRIYVGVHYPLDILGGFIVGILAMLFAIIFVKPKYRQLS